MSKKQTVSAMSSSEAEYMALSCKLSQQSHATYASKLSYQAIFMKLRIIFIKEQLKHIIELYFVRTEYQLADMFTKALPEDRFQYLVKRIGMRCLTPAELEVLTKESA
ncbi:hypothetical protein Tco_0213612 [Tanacetum coccineum]